MCVKRRDYFISTQAVTAAQLYSNLSYDEPMLLLREQANLYSALVCAHCNGGQPTNMAAVHVLLHKTATHINCITCTQLSMLNWPCGAVKRVLSVLPLREWHTNIFHYNLSKMLREQTDLHSALVCAQNDNGQSCRIKLFHVQPREAATCSVSILFNQLSGYNQPCRKWHADVCHYNRSQMRRKQINICSALVGAQDDVGQSFGVKSFHDQPCIAGKHGNFIKPFHDQPCVAGKHGNLLKSFHDQPRVAGKHGNFIIFNTYILNLFIITIRQPCSTVIEILSTMQLREQHSHSFLAVAPTLGIWGQIYITNKRCTDLYCLNLIVCQSSPLIDGPVAIVSLKERQILEYLPERGLKNVCFSAPPKTPIQQWNFASSEEKAKRILLGNRTIVVHPEHTLLFQAYVQCYWGSEASCQKGDKKICPENLVTSMVDQMPARNSKSYDQELMEQFLYYSKKDALVWNNDLFNLAEVMPNRASLLDLAAVRAKEPETWFVATDEKPTFLFQRFQRWKGLSPALLTQVEVREIVVGKTSEAECSELISWALQWHEWDQDRVPIGVMSMDIEEVRVRATDYHAAIENSNNNKPPMRITRWPNKGEPCKQFPVKMMFGNGYTWALMVSVPVLAVSRNWYQVGSLQFQKALLEFLKAPRIMVGVGVKIDTSS